MMMRKQVRENAQQNSAATSTNSQFGLRPFASPGPEHESLDREARFDHSFGDIDLFPIQPKLVIGPVDDKYEREADRVAEQVMRMPEGDVLQRKCAECDEDEKKILQAKESPGQVPLTLGQDVPPIVHDVLHLPSQSQDAETRSFFEPRFGHDFSQMRVHTYRESVKPKAAECIVAYSVGRDMAFGAGENAPDTNVGQSDQHELRPSVEDIDVSEQRDSTSEASINYTESATRNNSIFYVNFHHARPPETPDHSLRRPGPDGARANRAGYTRVILQKRMSIPWDTGPAQSGGRIPLFAQSVNIFYRIDPIEVFVSRDYAAGSCPYRVTLEHERTHVRDFLGIFRASYEPLVAELGRVDVPTRNSPRMVEPDNIEAAQDSIGEQLRQVVLSHSASIVARMEADRRDKDAPSAYATVYERCPANEWQMGPELEETLEEEEELRLKVAGLAPAVGGADVGSDLESAIRGARGRGQPLSDGVRQPMERAFGTDFGGVRVHTDGEADSLNRSIQAQAFPPGQVQLIGAGNAICPCNSTPCSLTLPTPYNGSLPFHGTPQPRNLSQINIQNFPLRKLGATSPWGISGYHPHPITIFNHGNGKYYCGPTKEPDIITFTDIESYYLRPGQHSAPTGFSYTLRQGPCQGRTASNVIFNITDNISNKLEEAEQEHVDDAIQSFRLSFGPYSELLRSMSTSTFGPCNSSRECRTKFYDETSQLYRNVRSLSSRLWQKSLDRDNRGWHAMEIDHTAAQVNGTCNQAIVSLKPSNTWNVGVVSSQVQIQP